MDNTNRLIEAVKAGKLTEIQALLRAEPELIHATTDRGEAVILLAVYYGQKEVADYLLSKATELTIFEAAAVGRLDGVVTALKSNADLLHAFSDDGWTALHLAAFFGHEEILQYLLDAGAQIDVAAKNEMAVLPLHSALSNRKYRAAEILIAHGADVNAMQSAGWTSLHYAAAVGNARIVEQLLAAGASRTMHNHSGQIAADVASEKGHELIAELLRK